MKQKLLIFGYGYVAKHLSQMLTQDYDIIGTSRSPKQGNIIIWNGTDYDAKIAEHIISADAILCSIPPNDEGDMVVQIFADALKQSQAKWLGYLSTTGVYGDHQGGIVDENTPLTPNNQRAKRRLMAEQQWQILGNDKKAVQIFRLPGIYGPGRNAFNTIQKGRAKRIDMRLKNGNKHFFCRAHVADIAGSVKTALSAQHIHHQAFNIVDDLPAPSADIIAYAANLMQVPCPELISAQDANMSDMAKSFYAECKFMKNHKLKHILGYTLKYPTYKQGLEAIWQDMKK